MIRKIEQIGSRCDVQAVAIDRWNSSQTVVRLEELGFNVVGVGQGFASLSAPCKFLESLLINENFRHPKHPVLTWNLANVVVEQDAAGNTKPSKKKSSEKIDGVASLINALSQAMTNKELDLSYEVIF